MTLLFTLGILVGCTVYWYAGGDSASVEVASEKSDCVSVSMSLTDGATLSRWPGHYELTLVETENAREREVVGSLTLRHYSQELDSLDGVSTPLYGYTNIDLRSVGAYRIGNPESQNPRSPGVLVLESDRDGQRVIILRIGSEANRRDSVRYDGAYTVLEVQQIQKDGFAGRWRSGRRLSRTKGYFCALKLVP